MGIAHHLRVWAASARYSLVRTLMFRFDTLMWALVEFFWMGVNLLLIQVVYEHTDSVAGWNKHEMTLLVGTAMLLQRLTMGLFWTNLFEMGRNIRSGHFDFFLSQPGSPLFMVSSRKIDPDALANAVIALGVVAWSVHALGLEPGLWDLCLYTLLVGLGLVIHYAALLLVSSCTFWLIGSQGIEGSYFTLFEFSRLPREAFRGITSVVFVYGLPAVVASNAPAAVLIHGFQASYILWLGGLALAWLSVALLVFHKGLKRYSSASS